MQIIYKNEDEKSSSGRADPVDFVIISRCIEREYIREFRRRIIRI